MVIVSVVLRAAGWWLLIWVLIALSVTWVLVLDGFTAA